MRSVDFGDLAIFSLLFGALLYVVLCIVIDVSRWP